MNEQAILDAYNLFVADGYSGTIDEFRQLIQENPEAKQDAYNLFVSEGYADQIDDFDSLMCLSQVQENMPVEKKKAWRFGICIGRAFIGISTY